MLDKYVEWRTCAGTISLTLEIKKRIILTLYKHTYWVWNVIITTIYDYMYRLRYEIIPSIFKYIKWYRCMLKVTKQKYISQKQMLSEGKHWCDAKGL